MTDTSGPTARILVSDKLTDEGIEILKAEGKFDVTNEPGLAAEKLLEIIGEYDGLVIRSGTQVTAEVLARADRLRVVGRAGVGVDNVDLAAATERGVIVMNTPAANTLSTAEHSISMMLSLMRNIPTADKTMKEGKWEKKSLTGSELYGKTLGVLGLGKIGMTVAERMRAFGMTLIGYDPFVTPAAAEKAGIELGEVDEICRRADVITVHTPLNDETRGLINTERMKLMKPTAYLINCARGGIIDEADLAECLNAGEIAGAALDVFTSEPLPDDSPLRGAKNLIMSPHLAASTVEAQDKVTREITQQVVEVLSGGQIRNAVNAPSLDPSELDRLRPVLSLTEKLGKFISQYCPSPVERIEIQYSGTPTEFPLAPMTNSVLKGFLEDHVDTTVNDVNAMVLAKSRGVEIDETRSTETYDFTGLIKIIATSASGEVNSIGGTLFHGREPHIVMINDRYIDAKPDGSLIVIMNCDVPGIVGAVGTVLGNRKINIADMSWGPLGSGAGDCEAMTVINVDDGVPAEVIEELRAVGDIISVQLINL